MVTAWMIKKEKSCGPDISRSRREFMSRSFPTPEQVITGTVKELAEKYNTEILIMTGFLVWYQ